MKKITITTQAELDALLEVAEDEEVEITGEGLRLTHICVVRGSLAARISVTTSWQDEYFQLRGNASAELRGNASAVLWENASAVLWENASAELRENASAVLRENASAELWENASAELRENASAVLRENASAELWENAAAHLYDKAISELHGFSVAWVPVDRKCLAKCVSKTAHIQIVKPLPYLEREGVETSDGHVILFKRVSKDWKTQEDTPRETTWTPGTVNTHPDWKPETGECGEGKYHAVSRPYFGDEFRDVAGDRYVAIQIAAADLYEWPDAQYPHKIAFRKGEVLYECNRFGERIEPAEGCL